MSNLKILYPDIPARALSTEAEHAYDEDLMLRSAKKGARHNYAALASAESKHWISYDLGVDRSASANYLAIARADLLQAKGVTSVKLEGARQPRNLIDYITSSAWFDAEEGVTETDGAVSAVTDQAGSIADLVQATAGKQPYHSTTRDFASMSLAQLEDLIKATCPLTSWIDFSDSSTITETDRAISAVADKLGLIAPYTQATAGARPTRTRADNKEQFILRSEAMNVSPWTDFHINPPTAVADPRGGTKAWRITATATNNVHAIYQNIATNLITGTRYRCLTWIKRTAGARNFTLYLYRGSPSISICVSINPSTGVVTTTWTIGASDLTTEVIDRDGGWWEVVFEFTATVTGEPSLYFYPGDMSAFAGAGESVDIFEPILQTAAATREYVPAITGLEYRGLNNNSCAWFDGGDYLGSVSTFANVLAVNNKAIFAAAAPAQANVRQEIFNGSGGGQFGIGVHTADSQIRAANVDAGGADAALAGVMAAGAANVIAVTHDGVNITCRVNGGEMASVASGNTVALTDALRLGCQGAGSYPLTGHICEILTANVALNSWQQALIQYYLDRKWRATGTPPEHPSLNRRPALFFHGAQELHSTATLADIFAAGEKMFALPFKLTQADVIQVLFADAKYKFQIYANATGQLLITNYDDGGYCTVTLETLQANTNYILLVTQTGGTLSAELYDADGLVDSGEVASGDTSDLTGALYFGATSAGANYMLGSSPGFFASKVYDATELTRVLEYLEDLYFEDLAVFDYTEFDDEALVGPHENDFIAITTASDACRHWWLEYGVDALTGTPCKFPRSKEFFGSYFDFERDPDYEYELADQAQDEVEFSTGAIAIGRGRDQRYVFSLTWSLVTDAKKNEFCTKILQNPKVNRVWLYTDGNDEILADMKAVYCKVLSDQCTITPGEKPDQNTITAYFEQELG